MTSALSEDGDGAAPAVGHELAELGDARQARHFRADETDRLAHGEPFLGRGAQGREAAVADRPIHVPGGAEAAAPLAATAGLEEVHAAEHRLRRQHLGCGREAVEVGDEPAFHHPGAVTAVGDALDRVVVGIVDGVAIGTVGALDLGRGVEHAGTPAAGVARRQVAREELRHHLLALADQEEVEEVGDRLGIQERRRAAGQQQWSAVAFVAPRRDPGGREDVDDVQVVGLERDREREKLELAQRPPPLERHHRAGGLVTIREEGALAAHPRMARQDLEHRLEAEVGHPDRIGVGVDETDGEIPAAARAEEHLLLFEALLRACSWVWSHRTGSRRHDPVEYTSSRDRLQRAAQRPRSVRHQPLDGVLVGHARGALPASSARARAA